MKIGLHIDEASWKVVTRKMRNIAPKVSDNARKTMRRAAERIVRQAKLYVPEDTSALMKSIRLETSYGARGRLQVDVTMGGPGSVTIDGRLVLLDQYALIVHEHYEDFTINPSEKTKAKMMATPGKVGSGFLLRAAEEEENKGALERDMIQSINEVIDSENF